MSNVSENNAPKQAESVVVVGDLSRNSRDVQGKSKMERLGYLYGVVEISIRSQEQRSDQTHLSAYGENPGTAKLPDVVYGCSCGGQIPCTAATIECFADWLG